MCGKAEEDTADRKGHSGSSLLCHMISSSAGLLNDRLANQLGQQKAKAPQASLGGGIGVNSKAACCPSVPYQTTLKVLQ